MKIAVIGAGISGLSAAWLLSRQHAVTLFEQNSRAGGHSNTVDVDLASGRTAVDTGFIVYNTASYPNLVALFAHLGVKTARSDMSFAVSMGAGAYEYSGTDVLGIFGQPANLFRPSHLRMLVDIKRFFREAPALLDSPADARLTLGDYLATRGYSDAFVVRHIQPMAAAIWSSSPAAVLAFPAVTFVRFFVNHGLLQITNRPEWRTVVGGSRSYVRAVLADFRGTIALSRGASRIERTDDGVRVFDEAGFGEQFDACVVATHADTALAMLADADDVERNMLGAFRYQGNRAVLHTDASMMPKRKRAWSSWNYIADRDEPNAAPTVTYWMNRLQPLGIAQDVFLTLNPDRAISEKARIAEFDYAHPQFDQAAIDAQRQLWALQGRRRTWFCGSYFGFGFHEDGLQAGLAVAEELGGVRRPWSVENESGRLHLGARAAGTIGTPLLAEAAE